MTQSEVRPGAGGRPKVVMFHRKPTPHVFSIEETFDLIRRHLPDRFEVVTAVSSHPSRGVVSRARAMLEARGRQGDVNHVVGDVNFLAIPLDPARTVLTVHDCEFLDRAGPLKREIYRWVWLRLPAGRSRVVVVPTDAVRRDLEREAGVAPNRVRVIPNPVDPAFRPSPRPFPRDDPVILQVGTRPNKNLERVARALEGIPCRLVVLGPLGPEQRRLLERCRVRHEEVLDLSRPEVADLYARSDLVVFASTREGFGLPIVEAQATGRPVVTSNRPPMSDVAGEGACLVDPFDVGSIRAGIRRVIEDPAYREHLVAAGIENVRRFDPRAVAARYAEVYDEVLAAVAASSRYAPTNP